MGDRTNGKATESAGWINLQAPQEVIDLLEQIAAKDFSTKSATVRRLIVEEARMRGLIVEGATQAQG